MKILSLLRVPLLAAGAPAARRVNWFNDGGHWTIGADGLDLSGWLKSHGPSSAAPAITGIMPCCGCWVVNSTSGGFSSTGRCASATGSNISRQANALALAEGLTIEPTGAFPVDFLMGEKWMQPGSLASAVAMLETEGWTGLGIDNENAPPAMPAALPEHFRRLLGNLSKVMTAANKSVVVDVCSTWGGDIGGPSHLQAYAQAAPTNTRFMDMAEYNAGGHIPGGVKAQLANLKHKYLNGTQQLRMIAPAIGMTEMPGHENASCGGWPQCANISDHRCGCLNYGWNASGLSAFVAEVEALGITEIDVWRQDMTPPPGTIPHIPPWFISELAGFLKRGGPDEAVVMAGQRREVEAQDDQQGEEREAARDRVLSVLNPGYGGRASPSKAGRGRGRRPADPAVAVVSVSADTPVLVGNRTGGRLFFPLLQHSFGGSAAAGIMLRAQTSPDAEGSAAHPNTDAVFLSRDLGKSWELIEQNDPVQKRMCLSVPAASLGALPSSAAMLRDAIAGELCLPYAFHPAKRPLQPACQAALDAFCNNETLNGAHCIDPQRKEWGRLMAPYVAGFDWKGQSVWRCYSHESLTPDMKHWSPSSKTPTAYCSGPGPTLGKLASGGSDACSAASAGPATPATRNASLWLSFPNGSVAKAAADSIPVSFMAREPMHVAGSAVSSSEDSTILLTGLCAYAINYVLRP